MTVEYSSSTVTNMDMDNNKVGYSQFFEDGSKLRHSVYALRNRPFKLVTVCLGLLCVLLLAVVIGQSVHYKEAEQNHQNNLTAMSTEREKLQENLKTMRNGKKTIEINRNDLQQRNDYLSKREDELQINNNILTRESSSLKQSQTKLKANNDASIKEVEQLKASKAQLQTTNNDLTTAKDVLQKQHDSVFKRKNEIQASYESVTKERDNLQNTFNIATRSREQLQLKFNEMINTVEHLNDKYNYSNSEKEKIESSHQNLTISKETLQATYDVLVKATDELRTNYKSLVQERDELENTFKNAAVEKDLLKVNNDNLTTERDALQVEVDRLRAGVPASNCPTGWTGFQSSCYFTSVEKISWRLARENCRTKGADLAIIKSTEEMTFVNGLYSTDKEVWIGLTDAGVEGQWKWVDDTPLTTTFWGKDQPNSFDGRNQDCVEFWHRATGNGDWNDENCNLEQNFICEK
ncbi:hypothetical protein KUCAC02_016313 [Chaenocephalus aceratus]|uniref:Uncharacterized protein n=1 Tax=Chaenocephalus aceratus TaxID=36190 RepID=A0ACB9Y2G8_CHAAC|nr:hypothetical protein KUCAC02_016313 [Chaenocephalus aceratus]